eukprot:CAMPEP_0180580776 /NCGR_PEP_ID=MMETSP1037_2-20121125/13701_1 /TAXON_ID=632150 /ORGANISM="Azadinium spinosum, Strain 3D9" /LENGTH=52 /DNA_ID=CAMNT_0022598719 /DNA_START=363 /DNA_END=522 /DNA_ORIENTATION=-
MPKHPIYKKNADINKKVKSIKKQDTVVLKVPDIERSIEIISDAPIASNLLTP